MTDKTRPTDTPLTTRAEGQAVSAADDISRFLQKAQDTRSLAAERVAGTGGRLIFALDATMSRQATWDQAMHVQSEMFREAAQIGGLQIKLVYFRGFGECRASKWYDRTEGLARAMASITCRGGRTQIAKVLAQALTDARDGRVSALVYVGDCMEENVDLLCERAGELGLLKVPAFMFQEGHDPAAGQAFAEIARLSGGAHLSFENGAAQKLADLLKAVALYATGGRKALQTALEDGSNRSARLLIDQLR